jgi:predicted esterase
MRSSLLVSLRWAFSIAFCFMIGGLATAQEPSQAETYDIVVYGDSSGAVTAAISAKREARSVILVSPVKFLGGMSSSGLGATDFLGRRGTFGGIASEFYDGVAAAYGQEFVRSFEPHVGRQVFDKMIAAAGVKVVFNEQLDRTPGKGVKMNGKRIESITMLSGKVYTAKMFIDATYVGDLMAAAGVTYTVGREPESKYGEDMNGVRRGDTNPRVHYTQKDKDHFVKKVDPYIKPGDPSSGLLPYVFKYEKLVNGEGDKKIQAFNYRVCLTSDPKNRIPIDKPEGYREIDHELLLRNFDAGDERLPALVEPLAGPGMKVDWNNMHATGSDFPGANWEYPEASYEKRREIEKAHELHIRGFLWTLANNPRVPEKIRTRAASYGLPKDEFTDNGGWPWMIYIREARRMVSDYVMTQIDCEGKRSAPDPVGLGSFGMDSHCVQHFVTDEGYVQNEGVIWRVPPRPYGISYRSIIPPTGECENLFSPICLSATHVAHGSIRMEPVFMALSQSAAIAAGVAIDQKLTVQAVPYPVLKEKLIAAKQIITAAAAKQSPDQKKPAPKQPAQPKAVEPKAAFPKKAEVFEIDGNKGFIYPAPEPAKGKPWIWYGPIVRGDFIIVKHQMYYDAWMKAGITIAGFDQGEVRGSPASSAKFTAFYDEMVKRGYSTKPILLGQSRGGIMTLAWAVRNPDKVQAWAGIYPVCNIASYPLKHSKKETLADYAMTEEELLGKLKELNPIHNLAGLAKEKVPMFAVHGDKDGPVPYDDNTKLLKENYEALGGTCDVKIAVGRGHEISPHFFECQELIDFIVKQAQQ